MANEEKEEEEEPCSILSDFYYVSSSIWLAGRSAVCLSVNGQVNKALDRPGVGARQTGRHGRDDSRLRSVQK